MPGPVTAVTIAKGAHHRAAGALVAVGHGLIEIPLIVLIYFGLARFLEYPEVKISVGIVGGAVLVWMGVQMFRSTPAVPGETKENAHNSVLAGLALTAADPDYYPATVMNYKLGGSFNGFVNLVLREEKGYTYGARTGFYGSAASGTFMASSQVQASATQESVQIFRDLMTKYREGITEEDLAFTKSALVKSNARSFETLGSLLGMLNNIATYGLPVDYIKTQEDFVKNITAEKHQELAQKYIQPERMIYLVVGDAATQMEELTKLGFGKPILIEIK